MPFCPNCGTDVSDSRFCPSCGSATASPASGGAAADTGADGASPAPGEQPAEQQDAPQNSAAPEAGPESVSDSTRNIAGAAAYITPVAVILLLIEPFKTIRYIRFHSLQSLFYFGAWIVLQFVLGFVMPPAAFAVSLVFVAGWFFIAYKAFLGEMFELPLLGELAKKYL